MVLSLVKAKNRRYKYYCNADNVENSTFELDSKIGPWLMKTCLDFNLFVKLTIVIRERELKTI